MNKELTKEEAEEYYNKLWLENKDLIQENIDRLNKKRFAQTLMLAEKDKEIERLNNIINKAINILKLSAMNKGICTRPETDTIQSALLVLKGSDKE